MNYWNNLSLENLSAEINGVIYTEIWKDIKGYEGLYCVSNFGRVKSLKKNFGKNMKAIQAEKITKQRIGIKKNGKYCLVNLHNNARALTTKAHRLVALHFIDNPECKPQVNHLDGVKHNNFVGNLEWCTHSENGKHAFKTGLKVPNTDNPKIRGSKNVNSKLTENDVIEIRRLRSDGKKCTDIAKMYGILATNVSNIVLRHSWKHI